MARFDLSNIESKVNTLKSKGERYEYVDFDKIVFNHKNHYPLSEIEELMFDIAERGLSQALVVGECNEEVREFYGLEEGEYLLISGHRRTNAISLGNQRGVFDMKEVMCKIKHYDTVGQAVIDLNFDNLLNRQLTDGDYMKAYEDLSEFAETQEFTGRKRDWIAKKLQVSPAQVGKMENINRHAVDEVKELVKSNDMNIATANEVAKLDENEQREIASLPAEDVKKAIKEKKEQKEVRVTSTVSIYKPTTETETAPKTIKTTTEIAPPPVADEPDEETEKKTGWEAEDINRCIDYVFKNSVEQLSEESRNQLKAIKMKLTNLFKKDVTEALNSINK